MALEQPASGHLNTTMERTKLEDWLHPDEALLNRHTLQIQKIPDSRLDGDTLCVIFYCEAMRDTVRRNQDVELVLAVDAKQGEMKRKEGIVDVNLIAKDKLRTTNFARVGNKRCQGRAYTSHGYSLLNGAINVEGEEHFIFKSVLITVDRVRPEMPPAAERIPQLHKYYSRGMEAPRRVRVPKSRAVNEYFHLLQHLGGITGKSRGNSKSKTSNLGGKMNPANLTLHSGTHASQNQSQTVGALDSQRHLPSIHLYSRLFQGSLVKWEHVLNEPLAAQYLGADGPGQRSYTMRLEAQTL